MNTSLPSNLAPYILQAIRQPCLTLLTSVLDTPASWLLLRFISAALSPDKYGAVSIPSTRHTNPESRKVMLVSLWRSIDTWSELLKKVGINLQDALSTGRLQYIDGLSSSTTSKTGTSSTTLKTGTISLPAFSLKGLGTTLTTCVTTKSLILIDGLDFLLAAESASTTLDAQRSLLDLQASGNGVIVTCAADGALLHNIEAPATPLEIEHAKFVRILAHGASWVFQLRPLETGQSREVSGSVRISRGGAWDEDDDEREGLVGGEWLYHVKGDGSVRVWGRGEA